MSELHDHWLEQRIFLYESRYESRLRLSDNLYTNSHKKNKTEFIPLDELPEYKKDRKRYLNLTSRHDRNNKRIHKGKRHPEIKYIQILFCQRNIGIYYPEKR